MRSTLRYPILFGLVFAAPLLAQSPRHTEISDGEVVEEPAPKRELVERIIMPKRGFLTIPVVMGGPTIGFGGGVALVWYRMPPTAQINTKMDVPPFFAVTGFYAGSNQGGAGMAIYRPSDEGRVRYVGLATAASLDLKFYGANQNNPLTSNPLDYQFQTIGTTQKLQLRIAEAPIYAGLQYTFAATQSEFELNRRPAALVDDDLDINIGGLGTHLEYDNRNSFIDATQGSKVAAGITAYSRTLAGSGNFGRASAEALLYAPLQDRWGVAARLDAQSAWGDVPFFFTPYVSMRGLRAQRFAGRAIASAEGEVRMAVNSRWTLIGFGGAGGTSAEWSDFGQARAVGAGGAGFRYLILKKLGIRSGIDVASGSGGGASVYIQNGATWR